MAAKKCLICKKKFVDKIKLVSHISRCHSDVIPKDWSASRYENYLRTGQTHGKCVECGIDTEWNESTMKYHRYCSNPDCKKKAREKAKANYISKWGKITRLDEPDIQKKMVYGRKNSGEYKWSDHSNNEPIMYDSTYGLDFLKMCDVFLDMDGSDMMGPSPNVYYYIYENKKHFYIPDFYIPSINLEVEIKDGGDNPNMHPKIQAVDKVKESLKDKVMESQTDVKYIKICNKQYDKFFKLLMQLKNEDEVITQKSGVKPDILIDGVEDDLNISTENISPRKFDAYVELIKLATMKNPPYSEINEILRILIHDSNKDELSALYTFIDSYYKKFTKKITNKRMNGTKIDPTDKAAYIELKHEIIPYIEIRMKKLNINNTEGE